MIPGSNQVAAAVLETRSKSNSFAIKTHFQEGLRSDSEIPDKKTMTGVEQLKNRCKLWFEATSEWDFYS